MTARRTRRERRSAVRRGGRILVAAAACLVLAVAATGCRPIDRSKPILLIHGWSLGGGTSCASTFDGTISQLRSQGFTGPFVKVGFYTGDTGCDMTLRSWGSFDNGSSWKEVAKALSHYVHATYTSQGVAVDIVGHSMGGNIARGAVQGSSRGEAGFSAPIKVEDVASLAAPFDGAAWYSSLCLWGQCSTIKPGAADIQWLDQVGDPQGVGGTEWTAFGSAGDDVVPLASAHDIAIPAERKVTSSGAEHSDYMTRSDIVARIGVALAEPGR